jgi:hypothetical protein
LRLDHGASVEQPAIGELGPELDLAERDVLAFDAEAE